MPFSFLCATTSDIFILLSCSFSFLVAYGQFILLGQWSVTRCLAIVNCCGQRWSGILPLMKALKVEESPPHKLGLWISYPFVIAGKVRGHTTGSTDWRKRRRHTSYHSSRKHVVLRTNASPSRYLVFPQGGNWCAFSLRALKSILDPSLITGTDVWRKKGWKKAISFRHRLRL